MKHALKKIESGNLLAALPQGARVLIVRLRPLGDMVLLTPALAALHAWRPDLRLSVLAELSVAPVLEGNPAVAEILLHRGFASTIAAIRKRHFAVIFNQHSGPTSALLTAFSGAPARVCWVRRQFPWAYNIHVESPAAFFGRDEVHTEVHTVMQRMTQFYATGLPQGPIPPAAIYPPQEARESVSRLLNAKGIAAGGGYAVVRPGATHPAKRWSLENFAAIALWLRRKQGIATIVNLGPGDEELAEPIRHLCGAEIPVVAVVDGLALPELMALLAGARLLVGNDCGPTHIAAAARVPIVVLFGASNSVHWRPWCTEYRLLQSEQPVMPGLPSIRVEQVQAACAELLSTLPATDDSRVK
jgi:ADP-heptose:LPS heptosyltransferase